MQYLPMALAIGSTVTNYIGQAAAARDQEEANRQLTANAIEARNNDLEAIEARRIEERDAASQKLIQAQRQALQERSQALAASAQAGQSGISVNALLNDYLRQGLENEQTIQTNLSNVNKQLDRERVSVMNTAKSRINSAPRVNNPSFIGTALQIGSDAYNNLPTKE